MTTKKHDLTTGADNLISGSGKDLFNAPLFAGMMTLNSADVLDGGKGIDTIKATLLDGTIAPVMKHIEHGIFTTSGLSKAVLDLSHASAMTDLTFQKTPGNTDSAQIYVTHAAHVSSLSIRNAEWDSVEMDGVDPTVTSKMDLAFKNTDNDTLALFNPVAASFDTLDIHLNNAMDTTLQGTVGADELAIHSDGTQENELVLQPTLKMGAVHDLSLTGKANFTFFMEGNSAAHLRSIDTTGFHANDWLYAGGKHLTRVTGGDGIDYLSLSAIGGTKHAPAHVSLGAGYDTIDVNYAFNAATQHYNGGSDDDTIILHGAAEHLNHVKSFEDVQVHDATGLYETKGMDIVNFEVWNTTASTTIDHLADKATLVFLGDMTDDMTVNVAGAAAKTTDSIRVLLDNNATIGNQFAGLMTPSLSNLQIDSRDQSHVMYLGAVGSASHDANVMITGTSHLELHASNGAMNYISSLTIDNDAGADISGLADSALNFAYSGATISGGAGADILIGGNGNDAISTGAGNNTVIGSLGADVVTFTAGSGMDTLVFNRQGESAFGGAHDTVLNFGAPDNVDLTALGINVQFEGNVTNNVLGVALLSSAHASAYFNTTDHMLYVDLNHDGKFSAANDMQIQLDDLATFSGAHLFS